MQNTFFNDKNLKFSAAILAGGKNSRFNGMNKSFLLVDNQYIIDRIIDVLKTIFSEIIIVSNTPEAYSNYQNFKVVSDYYQEIGPIGGIHAALNSISNPYVFIVSCDMPFLSNELIIKQLNSHIESGKDITIPLINGLMEPLHGIYSKAKLPELVNFIENTKKFKIIGYYDFVKVNFFDIPHSDLKFFTNINKPDDYELIVNAKK
jgi:molybdopterin-guanine dinucleotide biosynthesis protein A